MIGRLAEIFFLSSATLFCTSIGFAVAWVRARERAARAQSYLDGMRAMMSQQHGASPALDAIATEVERIGEGQRYLTRLLAESSAAPSRPRAPGTNTPH